MSKWNLYLLIFTLLMGNARELSAQIIKYEKKVSIGVSAKLVNYTSLVTIRDVVLNASNTVAGVLSVSPITNSSAGLMRINATPNSQVRVTYLANETLLDEDGSDGVVKARYVISGFTEDNQAASILLDAGEAIIKIGSDGQYFIWLGAELDLSKAKPGSYRSEFIIEIDAN